ncbi:30S ribosomal protein S12 methylthiotransferase RimO [Candidatus Peregrinibacteria bacterium]|nr:30S ribosomal protein S12 methylthiotransferase RimO [Candidatus Peregrinibacteria bacterium]
MKKLTHPLPKVGAITLGCPKNTADTENVLATVAGVAEIANVDEADIVLLNTCGFLKTARDEVYEKLGTLKNKKVILFGCMAGIITKDIFKDYPQVHAVVSGFHYPKMPEVLKSVINDQRVYAVAKEPLKFVEMRGKLLITSPSYAYIKIAEGCDNACSFCFIPALKGKYRSRPFEPIVQEAKELLGLGVKELILVAQDSGIYGFDLYGKKRLPELLTTIAALKGDFWVRVLYVYPERIDDELLTTMAGNPKLCKYLDMPLQHGDPDVLKAMRRPYDVQRTIEKIEHIRKRVPGITLRTSLIVGFPGETAAQFTHFLDFLKTIHFDHAGVFQYSREEGTKAFHLEGQLDDKTKQARHKKAMLLQQKISFEINQSFVGKTLKALIESYDEEGKRYLARPMRYAPEIDGTLFVQSKKKLKLNEFREVKITQAEPYDLFGTAI